MHGLLQIEGWRTQLEANLFGRLHASPYYVLCGKKGMQGFFWTKRDREDCCGIQFTFIPPCGPLGLLPLCLTSRLACGL